MDVRVGRPRMKWRKTVSVYVASMLMFLPLAGSAAADGGVIGKSGDIFFLGENSQYAVIDYSEGVERMLLSISFEWRDSTDTAWIFPIPAEAENVQVSIVDGAPKFTGADIVEDAGADLGLAAGAFALSYVFSLAIPLPLILVGGQYFMMSGLIGTSSGATVHLHLEKYGFVVEVISATGGAGIYNYLTSNGLEISEGIIPQLDDYVDKDFSFVVTWVSGYITLTRNPGILVCFPTSRMYYPLALTSIYGSKVIPTEIYVIGHAQPLVYDEIRPYTDVAYYRGSMSGMGDDVSPDLREYVGDITSRWNGAFTRIELSAPSDALKKDLWISSEVPLKAVHADFVRVLFDRQALLPTLLVMFMVVSLLMSLLVGLLVLGNRKKSIPLYLVIGMSNMIGILGVIISTNHMKRRMAITDEQATSFIASFCLGFFLVMLALFGTLFVPLL